MTDHELQQDTNLALSDDEQTLWGSRLVKKSLFDADGSTLGSIQDILLVPAASENRLYLRGFVASVDRRLIFVHEARVDAVDRDGLHLRGGTLDLRIFKKRHGEMLLTKDIYTTRLESGSISDVGFTESGLNDGKWFTNKVAFSAGGRLRKRNLELSLIHI